MKIKLVSLILFFFAIFSCDDSGIEVNSYQIVGLWERETVYLNGVNSATYTDVLNGTNFLSIKADKTFERAYESGTWDLSKRTLKLEKGGDSGYGDWAYRIIDQSENLLILEMRLTESQYCCNFDQFMDDESIIIKEVYTRLH